MKRSSRAKAIETAKIPSFKREIALLALNFMDGSAVTAIAEGRISDLAVVRRIVCFPLQW